MAPQPAQHIPAPVQIIDGLSALADRYDVILCDVWGVLHNGVVCYRAATDALARFRAGGGTVVLITNSPRPHGPVRAQMDAIGVPHDAYDNVVTSGDVTVACIMERGTAPLFHIGPPRDLTLFDEVRRMGGAVPPLAELEDSSYAVVTGLFVEDTDTPETYDARMAVMRERGMAMICANPDLVVHVGDTLRYCAGAVAARYEAQGGIAIYAGKPHAPIYETSLALAAEVRGRPFDRSRVLAIGDAMHTDVAGAVRQGLDVLFITSGIHRDDAGGDSGLDAAALEMMIWTAPHRPQAAIPALAW